VSQFLPSSCSGTSAASSHIRIPSANESQPHTALNSCTVHLGAASINLITSRSVGVFCTWTTPGPGLQALFSVPGNKETRLMVVLQMDPEIHTVHDDGNTTYTYSAYYSNAGAAAT
jgi:hypothetical protein